MLTRSCLIVLALCLDLCWGSGFCAAHTHGNHEHHHCNHGHHHHHDQQSHPHHHHHYHDEQHDLEEERRRRMMLPEELAEEEDMRLYGFGPYHGHDDHEHEHEHPQLTGLGLWLNALGCSLLVSLASLICLVILPIIFIQGKPSKAVVDSLALFGAGAMLGDAFLHQLPHAFGGEHSHSQDHHAVHFHDEHSGHGHGHAHSIKELSVGLSVLAGIVLFLIVEKIVRCVEEKSGQAASGHHHHHHSKKKLKDDDNHDNPTAESPKGNESDRASNGDTAAEPETLRKRKTSAPADDKPDADCGTPPADSLKPSVQENDTQSPSSLVFGYLNLFSDGVHNFTDGVALGSAFLLYGSVGGWSRTLFLLAHELPQEIGDFGILVRSGFSVSKALFFNFLSALVALAGTAVALLLGKDPGQSSLIEGFTAGGFIYIAVAGVLAEMNSTVHTTFRSTIVQLISLTFGMGVALYISLKE